MSAERVAIFGGLVGLMLIVGALGFQYFAGFPPCEMCHWQRWPHIAAAVLGIPLGAALLGGRLDKEIALPLAILVLLLVTTSGAIGAYQAGVEWGVFPGPAACTGGPVLLTGSMDLNHPVVRCDIAAWRLFGISLAGYNALVSFAAVAFGSWALLHRASGRASRAPQHSEREKSSS